MNTKTEKCKWCGRMYTVEQNPVWKKGGFGWDYKGHKGYCSNKCMQDAKGTSSSSGDNTNPENNAELARIEWEKEQAEKREEAEKKAKREAKVKKLKEQNKPYSAFLVKNGGGIGTFSGLIAMFLFIAIMQDKNDSLRIAGFIVTAIFIVVWGFLGFKYLKEYFRK